MTNPILTAIPSKTSPLRVDENVLRAMLQARMVMRASAAELRTWVAVGLEEVLVDGVLFDRDPLDTTAVDDGVQVIVSSDGARFKRRPATTDLVATPTVAVAAPTLATGALALAQFSELYIRVAAEHNSASRTLRLAASSDGTNFTPVANIATFATGGGVINRGTVRVLGLRETLITFAGTLSSGVFGAFTHLRLELDNTGNLSVGTLMEIRGR